MFRWNLMLRKLFGSLPQQSKARRPKATVKPHVEELTPRILPSASPLPVVSVASPPAVPSVAAITSYVSSLMELRSQLIATIEQDLSNVLNTIGQELYSVGRQWDSLMGITPSTPSALLNTSVAQPDRGMGRGNSIGFGRGSGALARTQNAQNQTLHNSGQQTGHDSGSGSNATTASDADAPPHRLMKAQPLTSPGSVSGDTYQWDPGVGYVEWGLGSGGGGYVSTHIYTPQNLLAGNPVNWLKNGGIQSVPLGQQPTVPGNKPGDTAVLGYGSAGAAGLQPIEWNGNFTFSTLIVQNGYAAQQTLDAGDKLEMTGVDGFTLTVDASSEADFNLEGNNNLQTDTGFAEIDGDMEVAFLAAGSVVTVDGGTQTYNKNVTFEDAGKVNVINGGTLNLANGLGATQSSGSPINVTNGTLNIASDPDGKGISSLQLSNASADINIGPSGKMTIADTRTDVLDTTSGGAVINNNGTVTLNGNAQGANNTITGVDVPLQNHGTVNVNSGRWWFGTTDVSGNAMSMDAGAINLNGNATVKVSQYIQTGGTFSQLDSQETFMALAGGSINFNGGTVQLTSASDWATLNTNAITFNGATLNIAFSGGAVSCDLIKGTTCTIQAGTINVNQIGNLNPNLGPWTLIQATAGNITGDFSTVKLPPGIMENPVTNTWSCKPK